MGTTTSETLVPRVSEKVGAQGRRIYDEQLKAQLEPEHTGRFVAIEPETARYFLGESGGEALMAAHAAMPGHQFFLKRIGHDTTYKIGSYGISRG